MELRALGKSGLKVSTVGLGCNNFGARIDFEASRRVIHKALDLGITLVDTADVSAARNSRHGRWWKRSGHQDTSARIP